MPKALAGGSATAVATAAKPWIAGSPASTRRAYSLSLGIGTGHMNASSAAADRAGHDA
jgi:hypothetical protein